jgi:hypothetical protein
MTPPLEPSRDIARATAKNQRELINNSFHVSNLLITVAGKGPARFLGHLLFVVGVNVAVDVSAARATNCNGLTDKHSTNGNAVHLFDTLQ